MLKNKVALITGASKGIGRAIAIAFANNHANIVINYNKSKEEAEEVIKELREFGIMAFAKHGDISKKNEAEDLINYTVKKLGKIDILVNNAGMGLAKDSILDIDVEEFNNVIDTNLKGTYYCTIKTLEYMKKQKGGKIVSISTSAVDQPRGGTSPYTASKAGVEILMNSCAQEFGPFGINCNTVAPGPTETEMLMKFFTPERKVKTEQSIPLRRLATPSDIAQAVLFFASPMSDYVTGQKVVVDGGRTIR